MLAQLAVTFMFTCGLDVEKEAASKNTLSLALGMHVHEAPPVVKDQCAGSSQLPPLPIQYRLAAKMFVEKKLPAINRVSTRNKLLKFFIRLFWLGLLILEHLINVNKEIGRA